MSWALVNRGLDLGEDQHTASKSRKVDKQVLAGKGSRHQREKRAAKQRKVAEQRQQQLKSLLGQRQGVSALEKYQQNAPKDRTLESIKLLKKIDRKCTPLEYVDKILSQHSKQLERRAAAREAGPGQGKNKPQKETSVFSDEDFERMNKEWLKLY